MKVDLGCNVYTAYLLFRKGCPNSKEFSRLTAALSCITSAKKATAQYIRRLGLILPAS